MAGADKTEFKVRFGKTGNKTDCWLVQPLAIKLNKYVTLVVDALEFISVSFTAILLPLELVGVIPITDALVHE